MVPILAFESTNIGFFTFVLNERSRWMVFCL
jgi:hypothetical protein